MRYGYAGVILAAGASTRMGQDKALLRLPDSEQTFLGAAIQSLQPHTQLVIVVAGANAESLKPVIYANGAFLVVNPDPAQGQFSSLQVGLQEVLNRGRDTAVITHVDRLPVQSETVSALISRFEEVHSSGQSLRKWAVVPAIPDSTGEIRHGHPIIAGRELLEAFLRAAPNTTARDIEHHHQPRIEYLPVADPNILANINTPEDYNALLSG